jgi:NAD(P)-dependent dehydrogenase (short-subunit alcohol dehydrogenase family)
MKRAAIVAGATFDTSLVSAVRLAERGLDVALIDGDLAMAETTIQQIKETGRRCAAIEADLADTKSFDRALDQARSSLGIPGVLLSCISLGGGSIHSDEERFAETRQNLRTLFVCCRAVAGHMVRNRWGRIINVAHSAVAGDDREWRDGQTVLAGLTGFTRSAALELAAFGITANFIAPSACAAGGPSPVRQELPNVDAASYPESVARLTEFLISEQAAAITGQGSYVAGHHAGTELNAGSSSLNRNAVGR